MSSQHYSLRWNNHQSHVLSAFDTLLQNESLVDCTLVCEDTSIRAHKVVLSACSPYFQKIFTDNSCKHPIIVLKDIRGWEVQCIVDFMYKGETSVPEPQLSGLIRAAESLRVRGLSSSDSFASRNSPNSCISEESKLNNYTNGGSRCSSPSPSTLPRRKQARPRRRSGESSLDLSKPDNPRKSPSGGENLPENLSMKRNEPTPAINLVKTETLLEHGSREMDTGEDLKISSYSSLSDKSPKYGQIQEQEARVEALQALNYMASGGGIPPHFTLNPPPTSQVAPNNGILNLRSTNGAGNSFNEGNEKSGFEFQRISIDRSKMSEEEAFEHAIEMIQTRQMGFRKAADFFSVSKWKLYKTARKRGIYAEIKKQNQAQQNLSKVPSNVQHFADMGVYKQLKKKAHLTKEILFPHLPSQSDTETLKVYKTPSNNNNSQTPNNNNSSNSLLEIQKKLSFVHHPFHTKSQSGPDKNSPKVLNNSDLILEDEEDEEDEERVLVINHREIPEEEDEMDSEREDSA